MANGARIFHSHGARPVGVPENSPDEVKGMKLWVDPFSGTRQLVTIKLVGQFTTGLVLSTPTTST